jgi:hypothetical protein
LDFAPASPHPIGVASVCRLQQLPAHAVRNIIEARCRRRRQYDLGRGRPANDAFLASFSYGADVELRRVQRTGRLLQDLRIPRRIENHYLRIQHVFDKAILATQ